MLSSCYSLLIVILSFQLSVSKVLLPAYYNVAGDKFGGTYFDAITGIQWIPDNYFVGGSEDRMYDYRDVANSPVDNVLYQWQRTGDAFYYEIPLENGLYEIQLLFAEQERNIAAGQRLFGVEMEGQKVLSNIDVVAEAGYFSAVIKTVKVNVADEVLDMKFYKTGAADAFLSGIIIQPLFPVPQVSRLPAKYEGPFPTNILAVAAMMRYDGKVIFWSSSIPNGHPPPEVHQTYISIFDPDTTEATRMVVQTDHDMFCPGVSTLEDGRVLVSGGRNFDDTSFYDPFSDRWYAGPKLNVPRGYQSQVTLGNGEVFTMGGSWQSGFNTKFGEVFNVDEGAWTLKSGLIPEGTLGTQDPAQLLRDNFMWFIQTPDGRILHAGPSRYMHWIDISGDGSSTLIGTRGDALDAMCGNAVVYDIGKVLVFGGSPRFNNRSRAHKNAYIIDVNGPGDPIVTRVADMNYARGNGNSAVLPNGEILVVGGQWAAKGVADLYSELVCEIWSPITQEFTLLEGMIKVPRNYHSTLLLLRDGRVITAGQNNHFDAEIITPPYLLDVNGDELPRPVIVSATSSSLPYRNQKTVPLGGTITVEMDSNEPHTFALVRLGAVTHSTNIDQRRVPLQILFQNGNQFVLECPDNTNVVPPGSYFLFAMNAFGVPSVADYFLREPLNPDKRVFGFPTPAPPTNAPTSILDTATKRINVGEIVAVPDKDGNIWEPETAYLTFHRNDRVKSTGGTDSTSPRSAILRNSRDGTEFVYDIPVPFLGEYRVDLHFLENWALVPDSRTRDFTVFIQGTEYPNLNIYALAGDQKYKEAVLSKTVKITSASPTITIRCLRGSSSAMLMGITVLPINVDTLPTGPEPTLAPVVQTTSAPTLAPTGSPTSSPSNPPQTGSPTGPEPTLAPVVQPTSTPTLAPTGSPTSSPSNPPQTGSPTGPEPTLAPVVQPTSAPTLAPTGSPTWSPPTGPPSNPPNLVSTETPSGSLNSSPTGVPTSSQKSGASCVSIFQCPANSIPVVDCPTSNADCVCNAGYEKRVSTSCKDVSDCEDPTNKLGLNSACGNMFCIEGICEFNAWNEEGSCETENFLSCDGDDSLCTLGPRSVGYGATCTGWENTECIYTWDPTTLAAESDPLARCFPA